MRPRWATGPSASTSGPVASAEEAEAALVAQLLGTPTLEQALQQGVRGGGGTGGSGSGSLLSAPLLGDAASAPSAYKSRSGFGMSTEALLGSLGAMRAAEGAAGSRAARLGAERRHDKVDRAKRKGDR